MKMVDAARVRIPGPSLYGMEFLGRLLFEAETYPRPWLDGIYLEIVARQISRGLN